MNLANEGLEAKKKEEEQTAKKRKAEDDAQWEGSLFNWVHHALSSFGIPANREQRVGSWRSFANANKKKKKTKATLLG
jgi:DnaJ homolog subfamily C member 8